MSINKFTDQKNSYYLGIWLLICAASVFIMVVVGGITRLTQSGLSMVEWAPIMGVLPPMSVAEWEEVFAKYRASPEYLKVNSGMILIEFKSIFWWEYGHRVLGRAIGMIYLIPLLLFLARGMVQSHWRLRLFGLFILGGLQGLMGWYMVKSGLVDVPHVSQYRLTAHLGLALIIFGFMWWYALSFLRGDTRRTLGNGRFSRYAFSFVGLVFLMILSGGFVAGTKAGFIMNTFPSMNGEWIPAGAMAIEPAWLNLFENPVTVQLTHRFIALIIVVSTLLLCFSGRQQPFYTAWQWLLLAMGLQVSLGITALLMQVPVFVGAAHQGGAVVLFACALMVAHKACYVGNSHGCT